MPEGAEKMRIFFAKDGAASVIRTRDLTLTKGALYHWSYSSTWRFYYIKTQIDASKHYAEKPAE